MRKFCKLMLVGTFAVSLAACEDNDMDPDDPDMPDPDPPAGAFEDQFGDAFGAAFRQDPNSEPIDPMDGDIIPVSLTDDPVDVENQGDGD